MKENVYLIAILKTPTKLNKTPHPKAIGFLVVDTITFLEASNE